MMIRTLIISLFISCSLSLVAQELSKDDLYEQAMKNAKVAFEAEQFSAAVMFYREAQRIKPESHLPRYKIEDIRTIYIANELDTLALAKPTASEEKTKKKKKKEIEAEKVALAAVAQEQATVRMNADAEQEKQAMEALKIEAQVLDVSDEVLIEDDIEVEEAQYSLEGGLKKMESNKSNAIETQEKEQPAIKGEKREVKPIPIVEEPKSIEPKVVKSKPQSKTLPQKDVMSTVEKQEWVEKEKKRLAEKYPNNKTVEVLDKPGKQITRVIMNIEGKVSVYLKVKHSWGATFFFIDEPGQDFKSINEQYFNLKTNLKTYGY